MIKAIIIDDEPKALEILTLKLQRLFPEINVVRSYENPEQALSELPHIQPDLVFLDIAMPGMNGFEWLETVEEPSFEVVFVTAYDEFALEALRHAAVGYVLKPIDENELKNAVKNALKNIEAKNSFHHNTDLLSYLRSNDKLLSIPLTEGIKFIRIDKIVRLEGTAGYTRIVCENGKDFISSYSLGKFQEMLPEDHFIKTHRSHIVNLDYVETYLHKGFLELTNGDQIPLTRPNRKEFWNKMEKRK